MTKISMYKVSLVKMKRDAMISNIINRLIEDLIERIRTIHKLEEIVIDSVQ